MEELYLIMRDFLEVEYHQEALLRLLKTAEISYAQEEERETGLIVGSTVFYLESLQKELKAVIGRLDSHIAESAGQQGKSI